MDTAQKQSKELKHIEAALAHDLNNFLQVVMGSLELLSRRREFVPEIVQTALQATRQAASLADRLIAFSRLQPYEARVIELNTAVADLAPVLRQAVGEGVRVETVLSEEAKNARVDPRALRMVLLELGANARNAMPGGGTLTLSTAAAPQAMVALEVADTGGGMPREGTKSEAGLGFAIVDWCLRQAGGRREISSAPGAGTRVKLLLPAR
jgi:signal transduction histidine kinase